MRAFTAPRSSACADDGPQGHRGNQQSDTGKEGKFDDVKTSFAARYSRLRRRGLLVEIPEEVVECFVHLDVYIDGDVDRVSLQSAQS
jgi:hypothetical protein